MAKDKSRKEIYSDKFLSIKFVEEGVSDKQINSHWRRIQKKIEEQEPKDGL